MKADLFALHRTLEYLSTQAAVGPIPGTVWSAAAAVLEISTRQLRRHYIKPPKARPYFKIEMEHMATIKMYGKIKTAWAHLSDSGVVDVSYETFARAYRQQVDRAVRVGIRTNDELAMRKAVVYGRRHVEHRNDAWSTDHAQLPITVIGRRKQRLHPWVTLYLDEATRVIVSWAITDQTPNAEVVIATLGDGLIGRDVGGVFVGGKPARIRSDRGADFIGKWMTKALVSLGIHGDPAAPYAPQQKGKVERVIKTIQEEFCAPLPGGDLGLKGPHTRPIDLPSGVQEPLLSLEELIARFRDWVTWYNTERVHRSLDGSTPIHAYAHDPAELARYTDLEALRHALLRPNVTRRVDKNGISFNGRLYVDAALDALFGVEVSIGFMEERPEQIEVFVGKVWKATAKWDRLLTGKDHGRMTHSRARHFETVSQVNLAAAILKAKVIGAELTQDSEPVKDASDALAGQEADEALRQLLGDDDVVAGAA